jgi:hypothetical protein
MAVVVLIMIVSENEKDSRLRYNKSDGIEQDNISMYGQGQINWRIQCSLYGI